MKERVFFSSVVFLRRENTHHLFSFFPSSIPNSNLNYNREIKVGETVKPMYVDQMRAGLDMESTVAEAIATALSGSAAAGTTVDPAGTISISGRDVPVRQYCSWFNFKGSDQQKKVKVLSGGERNRLNLARTLAGAGNLLLVDEPTNEADVFFVQALEAAIQRFAGSTMVISHDRW